MRVPAIPIAVFTERPAGREAKLSYMGHATIENRHGLAVAGLVTYANGTAERRASEIMLKAKSKAAGRRITAGEDKAYGTADRVASLPRRERHTASDGGGQRYQNRPKPRERHRRTHHAGAEGLWNIAIAPPGDGKQHGTMRKTKHRGIRSVTADFMLNLIAYNLIRIPKLIAA